MVEHASSASEPSAIENLAGNEKLARFRLARSSGIGPQRYASLLERFGSGLKAIEALPRLLADGRWSGVTLARPDEIRAELEAIRAAEASVMLRGTAEYPSRLAEIADPPPVLLARGSVALMSQPTVAIVGARNASTNGCLFARRLARELAEAGLIVVSGLARGIDTAAHEGALETKGGTVAVIASGVDVPYPEENRALHERIAQAGCVVSERPMAAAPQARHFPRRNRIIAGLSLGIVVVEAAPQSGSLITARLAAEQGREVMAVPGSPLDPRHKGTNQLLREGAQLVESAEDVLEALGPLRIQTPLQPRPMRAHSVPTPQPRRENPVPPRVGSHEGGLAGSLLDGLGPEPVAIDELMRRCHASAASVQEAILELELEGRVERHPGNRIARKAE